MFRVSFKVVDVLLDFSTIVEIGAIFFACSFRRRSSFLVRVVDDARVYPFFPGADIRRNGGGRSLGVRGAPCATGAILPSSRRK